jgi:hypothetical protein
VKAAHVTGQCNLLLSNQKEKVLEQMSELSQIQEMLVAKEAQVKKMETEAALMEGEVQRASLKRGRVSELIENYTVSVLLDAEQTPKMKPVFLCTSPATVIMSSMPFSFQSLQPLNYQAFKELYPLLAQL